LLTWQQAGESLFAVLKITKNGKQYGLVWTRNGDPIFAGDGMLCGDTLIGDYR